MQAADAESARLHQSVQDLKQESQAGLVEHKEAMQRYAVAQADLRATRHQLKVLQQQVRQLYLVMLACNHSWTQLVDQDRLCGWNNSNNSND